MANMKLPLLVLCVLFSFPQHIESQTKKKPAPTQKPPAKIVVPVLSLSEREVAIINEINLARSNPANYAHHLERYRTYYQGKEIHFPDGRKLLTNEGLAAVDEAIAFLKSAKALPAYEVRDGMVRAAKDHLKDLITTGKSGHRGSDGSMPEDRVGKYGTWSGSVGEDIVYHSRNARDSVIGLIVDDGTANRGHRRNIFKTDYQVIGIALAEPNDAGTLCVITFAGDFRDKVIGSVPPRGSGWIVHNNQHPFPNDPRW
jgi:uncharacterized protein YkwD